MSSNSLPHLLRGPHPPSSSLVQSGMEIAVPPGQISPNMISGDQHMSKELRSISKNGYMPQTERAEDHHIGRFEALPKILINSAPYNFRRSVSPSPAADSNTHSSRRSPTMQSPTKSYEKILQLTGYNPWYDDSSPTEQQRPISSVSDASSGSVYSQPEGANTSGDFNQFSSWGSAPELTRQLDHKCNESYLGRESYSSRGSETTARTSAASQKFGKSPLSRPLEPPPRSKKRPQPPFHISSDPVQSLRYRDRPPKTLQDGRVLSLSRTPDESPDLHGQTTLRELLEEEQWKIEQGKMDLYTQFHRELAHSDLNATVPKPLVLRDKTPEDKSFRRSSLLTTVRENFATGMHEITSPLKSSHPNTPITPVTKVNFDNSEESTPVSAQPKRKVFGTGKHPLKSPFPFSNFFDTSDSEDDDERSPSTRSEGMQLGKRISGVMSRVSSTTRSSIRTTKVIRNSQRDANGPDTPMPTKAATFNEQLLEAYASAKEKFNIKSADERKRESLKKKIVVIGVTDQSPDGRLSEWL